MASIALITVDSSNASYTRAAASLTASGHTVTAVLDANVNTTNFSSYDVVGTCRSDPANATAVAAKLKSLVLAGKPILLDTAAPGTDGNSYTIASTVLGL